MAASTIEFTGGVSEITTRMVLKREMERFGPVDVCHMGNRQNPKGEPPWVRFVRQSSADEALKAIGQGNVMLDGVLLEANRSAKRGPPLVAREPRDQEMGSRDLFLKRAGLGGGGGRDDRGGRGGGRDSGRGRSRDRGGKRRRSSSSSSSSSRSKNKKKRSRSRDRRRSRSRRR
eukprot:TRINITY_DN18511_c0_g1_i1.p1 TRINITY_DN18511_c0_g1~~TRINITY_DN18511_c0_g1_i1.p1  ORF type:complete len:174 (+),score=22.76 TRINITY_DN18511_c0_g1_i1:231-752(+)